MGRTKREPIPAEIEALRRDIDHWRETREKLGPMPEDLWRKATVLGRRHGVSLVARELRLHHGKLMKRVEAEDGPMAEEVLRTETAFVELSPATFATTEIPQVVVEMTKADGSAMSLHLPATSTLEVASLVGAFFGRGR